MIIMSKRSDRHYVTIGYGKVLTMSSTEQKHFDQYNLHIIMEIYN